MVQWHGFIQWYYTHSEYRVVVMGEKSKTKGGENYMSLLGNFVHFMGFFSLLVISLTVTMHHGEGT